MRRSERSGFTRKPRPVVLVTGASSGIGLALSRLLVRREEFRVVLTARRASLARFRGQGLRETSFTRIRPLDVTNSGDAGQVFDEIERTWGGVDVLVNNAGILYRAVFEHMDEDAWQAQFAVNYFGPMNLIRRALPYMRAHRSGRIINISSVGGMMAMPTMSAYSASKFALEGASEGLWYELRPWNIFVSLVEPGFINSSGFENVQLTPRARRSRDHGTAAYHAHYESMSRFINSWMRRAFATPESVARVILKTLTAPNPPLRVPATFDAVFFSLLRRLLPRRLYHRVLYTCLPSIRKWGQGQVPTPRNRLFPPR